MNLEPMLAVQWSGSKTVFLNNAARAWEADKARRQGPPYVDGTRVRAEDDFGTLVGTVSKIESHARDDTWWVHGTFVRVETGDVETSLLYWLGNADKWTVLGS